MKLKLHKSWLIGATITLLFFAIGIVLTRSYPAHADDISWLNGVPTNYESEPLGNTTSTYQRSRDCSLTPITIRDTPTGTPAGDSNQPIQPWNLLATSKPNVYIPAFNKLVVASDSNNTPIPTILTKKLNGQCIAYQPSNTNIIKLYQQNSLVKLTSIPGGMAC